jgi:hypothetical protein
VAAKKLSCESSEGIVADPGPNRRGDTQPRKIDGRICGTSADVQNQLRHRDELAGPRHVI